MDAAGSGWWSAGSLRAGGDPCRWLRVPPRVTGLAGLTVLRRPGRCGLPRPVLVRAWCSRRIALNRVVQWITLPVAATRASGH
jgi:hypothetical protein